MTDSQARLGAWLGAQKDLILVDPDDELEISTVMAFRGRPIGR